MFTISGNISEVAVVPPLNPSRFQVVLEPLDNLPRADIVLGSLDDQGNFKSLAGNAPLSVPYIAGAAWRIRTLPETFDPIQFTVPSADGGNITTTDLALYATAPLLPPGTSYDALVALVQAGDADTLSAAKAYADTVGGGGTGDGGAALAAHVASATPHPAYDVDAPDLRVWLENGLAG